MKFIAVQKAFECRQLIGVIVVDVLGDENRKIYWLKAINKNCSREAIMKLQGKVLIGQALQLQMSTNTILSNFFHKNYFVCHVLCINPNAKTPNKSL